jgi:hypothetical protein
MIIRFYVLVNSKSSPIRDDPEIINEDVLDRGMKTIMKLEENKLDIHSLE